MKFQDVHDVPCDGGHLELLVAACKFIHVSWIEFHLAWASCVKAQAFQNQVGVLLFGTCTVLIDYVRIHNLSSTPD